MSVHLIRMATTIVPVYTPNIAVEDSTKAGVGGTDSASITFNTSGACTQAAGTSTSPGTFTWLLAGASSDFEIYFTSPGAETVTGSAEDTWLGLGTTRTWTFSTTNADQTYSGTYTIRRASGGEVGDGTVTMIVNTAP